MLLTQHTSDTSMRIIALFRTIDQSSLYSIFYVFIILKNGCSMRFGVFFSSFALYIKANEYTNHQVSCLYPFELRRFVDFVFYFFYVVIWTTSPICHLYLMLVLILIEIYTHWNLWKILEHYNVKPSPCRVLNKEIFPQQFKDPNYPFFLDLITPR